jgi:hypothetical protein
MASGKPGAVQSAAIRQRCASQQRNRRPGDLPPYAVMVICRFHKIMIINPPTHP